MGSSQRLDKLGPVYLDEYQIYTPIRWNDTAPPTPLAICGAWQENGCRHEGVLSSFAFTFFLLRQVSSTVCSMSNEISSIRLAVDLNARNS